MSCKTCAVSTVDADQETSGCTAAKPCTSGPHSAVELLRRLISQRPGGEVRPQQERMVAAVERAISTGRHLVVQAGTGTGKSLGYAVPAVASGKRVVISTATKQLSEQIVSEDLPHLAELLPQVGGATFTFALLKGRNNYLCRQRVDSLVSLDEEDPGGGDLGDPLFDDDGAAPQRPNAADLAGLNKVLQWAEETSTGDRSEAPPVSDRVWDSVSMDAAGCPGAKRCPFGEVCFAEQARAAAREADVVVTNHAQVAQDMCSPVSILGDYQVLIVDEAHELETYLSSAWGTSLTPQAVRKILARAVRRLPRDTSGEQIRKTATEAGKDLGALGEMLAGEPAGLKPQLPEPVTNLMGETVNKLVAVSTMLTRAADRADETTGVNMMSAAGKITEAAETIVTVMTANVPETSVRWLEPGDERQPASLKVAPLWVGPRLMACLGDRTLIVTSATLTVGGTFDSIVRTLALSEPVTPGQQPRGFDTLDVGTPFNYDRQAMLYIPGTGFPAPVGRDRIAHTEAVLDEVTALVRAAGGRTLALFTTRKAARNAAEHLRTVVDTPVLAQGDAPPAQLIDQFREVEESTLCATMGFWHGVNVPGPALSVVVIDKVPFAPMDDPLMVARRAAADQAGRNGFGEVYVAGAAIMLAQGAGRLIRAATDKGVVAILDPRLRTKGYGRTLVRSLPPMRQFADRAVVEAALARLTGTPATRAVRSAPGLQAGGEADRAA